MLDFVVHRAAPGDRQRLRDLQRADAGGGDAGGGVLPAARLAEVVARIDSWLPHRYAGVLRAQAREVDRILSAWLRGQAMCCLVLASITRCRADAGGAGSGADRGAGRRVPVVHPVCRHDHRRRDRRSRWRSRSSRPGPAWSWWSCVFIIGQFLEGYVIYPRFLGDRVELHAVWVIFALFAGRRGVRLPRRAAGGAGGGDDRRAVPVLAAPLPAQPALSRSAGRASIRKPGPGERRGTCSFALPFPAFAALRRGGFPDAPTAMRRRCPGSTTPRDWPLRRLALWGPAGCGKTHLLHLWRGAQGGAAGGPGRSRAAGAARTRRWRSTTPMPRREQTLLHLLNAAAEAGLPVLLAAREPPARWPVTAARPRQPAARDHRGADRRRRTTGCCARCSLGCLSERQLAVPEAVQQCLLLHLPRTPAAMREAAARLDHAALAAGGRASRAHRRPRCSPT